MTNISKRRKEGSRAKIKTIGDHDEFLKRITKTLYYGELPDLPCLSLPVTEISCELWSVAQRGRSLRRLRADAAAGIARSACVSPCALVLAILYLERLKSCNKDYLTSAAPADLFLVSLMVSNKFLQDDGEDDEVICSEWAASGGLKLNQLKKLEVEFLNAIDWNVYVNERSFEAGLLWLERQVALRQANLRGFFTYGDLAASCDGALLCEVVGALRAACAAAALAYLSGLLTLLTSTLVLSQAWLPALQYAAARGALSALDTNIMPDKSDIAPFLSNRTLDLVPDSPQVEEPALPDKLKCCTRWLQYHDRTETKNHWHDNVVAYDWKSFETWWSKTPLLNWLYHSSVIGPMQRWLEIVDEYADLFKKKLFIIEGTRHGERCSEDHHHCVWQWLNLSKLNMLLASAADR
ncbi:Protein CNPPD1 [Papilio machaon]|uniref:Protein CNPPD1 n=1 Tax=Papilio machaon TaxID=76193 RepID=A0A0N0PC44_PAPMA|nr:Protein CNPPD1 [Papilio machaon]